MAVFVPSEVITDPDSLSATVKTVAGLTISTITGNSNSGTVNVTTSTDHELTNGDYVTVTGTTNFNGTFGPVTSVGATEFSYSESNANADENTGTVDQARDPADEIMIDTTKSFTPADPALILIEVDASNVMKDAGVTLKALYSFLKDQWKSDATLIKFPFPMSPITDEQFEFTRGWNLDKTVLSGAGDDGAGVSTPYLIRTGGWAVNNARDGFSGTVTDSERWVNVISLGELDSNDQVYYRQVNSLDGTGTDEAPIDFLLEGRVNQAVQFYRNDNPDTDQDTGDANEYNYSGFLEVFVRTWGKTYAQTDLTDIGAEGGVTYQAYRFPLVNASDPKVTKSEAAAAGDDIAIDSLVGNGTTVTVTTESNHELQDDDVITISGATETGFNQVGATITVTGATTFTYANTTNQTENTSPAVASGYLFNNMDISWAASGDNTQQTGFNDTFTTDGVSVPEAYFTVTIDGDAGSTTTLPDAETIYQWVQAQLRKTGDINVNTGNTGARRGDITPLKVQFIGDDLYTLGTKDTPTADDYEGTYITNFQTGDRNRLHFFGYGSEQNASVTPTAIARSSNVVTVTVANSFATGDYITISGVTGAATSFNGTFELTGATGTNFTFAQTGGDESGTVSGTTVAEPAEFTNLTFPFISTVTLNFNSNLVGDSDAIYRVYFKTSVSPAGNDFGTKNAIIVDDDLGADVAGTVGGASSVQFGYAYDSNTQRGNSGPSNADIVVVAIGLNEAQWVRVDDTIARADLSISLVSPFERNYDPGTV